MGRRLKLIGSFILNNQNTRLTLSPSESTIRTIATERLNAIPSMRKKPMADASCVQLTAYASYTSLQSTVFDCECMQPHVYNCLASIVNR